ncbi:DNA-processing protein DprA [Anaerostipes sp.]|uniref:DNA-processing protein DprA n=1 Tax=Anaerostipes sp. TaxID=1872530 RepID=UPI0025C1A19D|nr:DNA-processing protein DprA [Anaerostipes sp.]MBS7008064.1 DNA-processing protein DprA [Anaerostipes sp.]
MNEKMFWFWFTSLLEINRKTQGELLSVIIHPEELRKLSADTAKTILSKRQYRLFLETREDSFICKKYEALKEQNADYIIWKESDYPERLRQIYDYPFGIFRKGRPADSRLAIAMVGARSCTLYGREMAEYMARELAKRGVLIVSGMARGIDGASHRGALSADGLTAGVLGCGIDQIYPKEHRKLYSQVEEQGVIYSEYGLGVEPFSFLFPQRNRIISGLADGIFVVEARERSGSLITADCGLDQNKEIFALPGNVTSSASGGCHRLIQQGAKLVSSPEDILNEFPKFRDISHNVCQFDKNSLARGEKMVYDVLSLEPKCLEQIAKESNLPVSEAVTSLFYLERQGLAEEILKNYYIIKYN